MLVGGIGGQCGAMFVARRGFLFALAAVTCVSALVSALVVASALYSPPVAPSGISAPGQSSTAWLRETDFLLWQKGLRNPESQEPYAPAERWKTSLRQVPADPAPDGALSVLVLGNSFVQPHGMADVDAALPVQIEQRLSAALDGAPVDVTVWAASGASPEQYAQWMRSGFASGDFDAVVVAVTAADKTGDRDRTLAGQEDYASAMNEIAEVAGSLPLVVVNPCTSPAGCAFLKQSDQSWRRPGLDFMPTPTVDSVMLSPDFVEEKYLSTPMSGHPGYSLSNAFAADIAQTILAEVPPGRLREASAVPASPRPLVSNFVPAAMSYASTATQATVSYTSPGEVSPGSFTDAPGQAVPCMPLGRPHVRVMLDPYLPPSSQVELSLRTGGPVEVFSVGYGPDGLERFSSVGVLSAGDSLRAPVEPPAASGFLLADGLSCPADATVDMPSFSVGMRLVD